MLAEHTPKPGRRAARRALVDDESDVLDDHQRLHVACTTLTEEWIQRAALGGLGILPRTEAAVVRQCAQELTELLRSHR